jgi:hypothetical protein
MFPPHRSPPFSSQYAIFIGGTKKKTKTFLKFSFLLEDGSTLNYGCIMVLSFLFMVKVMMVFTPCKLGL